MLRRIPRARRGFTLAETVVAMTLTGVVLALVTTIAVRQQRALADVADAAALGAQLEDARAILPADIRALTPSDGDVRDARDTAFEFRSTIASAIICDTAVGAIILAPSSAGPGTLANVTQSIEPGDSAWVLTAGDSSDQWRSAPITAVSTAAPGTCAPVAPALDATQRSIARTRLALAGMPAGMPAGSTVGVPVRITRPVRYSLYRASDGDWYLGQRDWNNTTHRLNIIQPVAGPLLSAARHGLAFTYFDSAGAPLATPVQSSRSIALVRIDLHGETRSVRRALGAGATPTPGSDSTSVIVYLRNSK
jgi:prepilin-type N-terminal cleavage/methylation domain-containing protein